MLAQPSISFPARLLLRYERESIYDEIVSVGIHEYLRILYEDNNMHGGIPASPFKPSVHGDSSHQGWVIVRAVLICHIMLHLGPTESQRSHAPW